MDGNLEKLIQKIKQDGVESAKREGMDILSQAQEEADRLIAAAKKESARILEDGQKELDRRKQSMEEGLKQAARDVVLSVRQELERMLGNLLRSEVKAELTGKKLEAIVLELLRNWKPEKELDISLSDSDAEALAASLVEKLKSRMSGDDFQIKPLKSIQAGLRISFRDGTAYFDFTDEQISKILLELLNPKFTFLFS